jgi:hypothetical protein
MKHINPTSKSKKSSESIGECSNVMRGKGNDEEIY